MEGMTGLTDSLNRLPKLVTFALGMVLVAVLGLLDYLTSYEVAFSIFYLLPIVLVAWFVGEGPGIFMSILSATSWLVADLAAGNTYSHLTIPLWNSIIRLGFFLIISYLSTTVKRLLEQEKELARTDSLTGVPNGRYFSELVEMEIGRAYRFKRPLTLAYLDIDDFKPINDEFGHSIGDTLLSLAAKTIKKSIRSTDAVARLGGDEFAILMPETDMEQAKPVISRAQQRFLDAMQKKGWPVTMSIGAVTCHGGRCTADQLVKRADDLMYSVKNGGKNAAKCEMLTEPEGII